MITLLQWHMCLNPVSGLAPGALLADLSPIALNQSIIPHTHSYAPIHASNNFGLDHGRIWGRQVGRDFLHLRAKK